MIFSVPTDVSCFCIVYQSLTTKQEHPGICNVIMVNLYANSVVRRRGEDEDDDDDDVELLKTQKSTS